MNLSRLEKRVSLELLFGLLFVTLLWVKFNAFDSALSPRFTLTPITFAGSVGVLLALSAPLFLIPRRLRGGVFVLLNFLLSFLLLINRVSLRYYTDLFSFRNLGLSTQAWEVADSIFALLKPQDLFLFADLLILFPLVHLYGRAGYWKPVTLKRTAAVLLCTGMGLFAVTQKLQNYNKLCPGAMYSMWDRPAVCISLGSLSYHAIDLWNTANERFSTPKVTLSEQREVQEWLKEWNPRGVGVNGVGVAAGKNLIVIQVEALQEFAIGLTLEGQEVTPNLNRLREKGLYFSHAYNQTASGNSSDAEFMANTSLFPIAQGVTYMRYAGNRYDSLGTLLKEKGYATFAFHGDRPGFWNRNHIYPSLGFERYISKSEFEPEESIGLGLSDKSFFKQSLNLLKGETRPFYAFLITLTSHYPFNFPALEKQLPDFKLGELEGALLGDYLRSIHYTDRYIGEFVKGLEEAGLLQQSLLVVYGDHPAVPRADREPLSKLLGHPLETATAWREIQKIPLIFYMEGESVLRGSDASPTGQMDIAPTVANLMGLPMPTAFGRDLLNSKKSSVLFRNGSYVEGTNWVDPGSLTVKDLLSGEEKTYTDALKDITEKNRTHLKYSDRVVEANLIPRLDFEDPN